MPRTAVEYLHEISSALDGGYPGDCVTHACALADLLAAEGETPWIARLRDVQQLASGVFHGPLTPLRLAGRKGPTWTTHYAACVADMVYDPLVGTPVAIAEYPIVAFGRDIEVEQFLDTETTAELCGRHELRTAFGVKK
ncbi:MAG TPA: hypothetical protein VGQ46_01240 [Thermoanaerobaculia bacterium]|nr:hypothetical protein [Thermoanaerobaculia bacterium]